MRLLRYKVKTIGSKALEKASDDVEKPKLHHNEVAVLEDELKPELDILNALAKLISNKKGNLEKMSEANQNLFKSMEKLKTDLSGE